MTSTANKISARERARSATAARLAEEQARIKQNEDDLAAFFKADENSEKAQADADTRIARIREETSEKLLASDATRASSLAALKSRGESVASIVTMTGLTSTEVNKLLKLARRSGGTPAKDSSKADSAKKDEKDSAESSSSSSDSSPTAVAS
ncbi:Uncharacterised protein [Rhodococcus erythropolis]|uniref:hypothetical protein n=1 Tax=Rhodococcus erythropolis TaxID=1833 RepID=UPI000E0275EB|nr:hypothetical protein [Rhodococcus erythropolis]SUH12169.1 Uncharacterised protein [Rhodococcus erythropolis]